MRRWLLLAASALAGLLFWRAWQRWQHAPDPFGPGGGFPPDPFPGTPSPAISNTYKQPIEHDQRTEQRQEAPEEQAEQEEEPALLERAVGEDAPPTPAPPPAPAPAAPPPAAPDDLILIEGIGPKIATILRAAGIASFAQLAEAEIGWLAGVLRDAGIATARPETWPMQARLAAQGDLAALRELQRRIIHGRLLS